MRLFFTKLALPLAALILLPSCGPADVDGRWEGQWRSSLWTGSLTLELTQDGDTFKGTFALGGTACVGSGDVSGSVDDRDFTATLRNGVGGEIELDGSVGAGDRRISGDFEIKGGWCKDARGTFDVDRD